MRTQCISDFKNFQSFQNCSLFCTFCLLRSFYSWDAQHANHGKQFKSSFPTLRTLCIRDLHCFRTSQNCGLFCRFWLLRNLNSVDSRHAYCGEHCSNHHFRHCAQCVSEIYSVWKLFEIAVCFAHFGSFEISTTVMSNMLTMANIVYRSFPTLRTLCIWHLQYFQSFRNGCLFCTFWLFGNLNGTDSHHAYYGEHCSNHHFRHCAQCVSEIYSVWKLFEIAVCFAHFGSFEISTTVMSNMLTMANIVYRSFPTLRTLCIWHLQYFQSFRNGCLFCTFWLFGNLNGTDSHHAYYGEHCSNHHFRHCAQCVSEIYSVWKLFEIAVCFAHFGSFEISTTVMSNMLTMANIV